MADTVNESVYIAGDIAYVSGTVNGTAYTWTLTGDHVWTATGVTRSDTGEYALVLTAIDTSGNEMTVTTTTYYGLHLVTDRIQGAYYNATDLNRVGAAVEYLSERLADSGYTASVSPKLSWTILDRPTPAQMQTYLSDVKTIRDVLAGTQELPDSIAYLTYTGANDIELALEQIDTYITRMLAAMVAQCGITYTGGRI